MTETVNASATWWSQEHADDSDVLVAYFSMEFGLEARLPIYSGGLGILAGDHLKAAAELGVPLVGVGLFYRGGYFTQHVSAEGRQTESYNANDPRALGLAREPVDVEVDLAGQTVTAAVWRADVGVGDQHVPLYLLDVDLLTDALYGGDREHRIRQELLLGVGGVRALRALGIEPTVYHVNEGHSAFLTIERARVLVEEGLDADTALERVRRSTVFTTHTPVPAGNEIFGDDLVLRYAGGLAERAGLSQARLLALGRSNGDDGFGLTPLALRLSAHANGVSELHGEVARDMWKELELRIDAITNGVHLGTWLAPELAQLLRQVGVRPEAPPAAAGWDAARRLDPEALWDVHTRLRRRLTGFAGLDPELLTIGFARRFATYKRAALVYTDLERLLAQPVQVVVAGKAHPQDAPGKDVMQEIVELSRGKAKGRLVFLEDYDIDLARMIIPGCDIWLNTPRRPYEASGTSGMKAAVNGVLNFSVLDGWWAEAYDPAYGWAIDGVSDEADVEQLYTLLEQQVVPAFRDRSAWIEMMKSSIAELAPRFSMQRTVIDYAVRYYIPAARAAGES
ncbi:MAG TPA: alpha-glucan family phosphorylase [Gaiellaceae bacterium]|jgi:starch phosphorylase|nr:alpha-glucan family phosphorylase [Gaiellaceae bacterium]